jgi:hypothetical protein
MASMPYSGTPRMIKMPKKSKTRSQDLQAIEGEILEIFNQKNLTISEALFIFEKIKFSAFVGLTAEGEKQARKNTPLSMDTMFR